MSVKIDRISSNIAKEIGYILTFEVKDTELKMVTVTDVKVTNDLSFAKVYVTVFDQNKKDETMKSLKNASGYIRMKLKERVDIRHIPELQFVFDESIDYGHKIEKLIEDIHNED